MNNTKSDVRGGSLFWRIWFRSISVKRPQAVLAVASLLVGAALAACLLNLSSDVRRKMTNEFASYGANILLMPAHFSEAQGAPVINQDLLERASARLRDAAYAPLLTVVMRVRRVPADPRLPDFENGVTVGTDFARLHAIYPDWRIERGKERIAASECILGTRFARKLHVTVGDSVQLEKDSSQAENSQAKATFTVAGVIATGAGEDDRVFLNLSALQKLSGLDGKISVAQLRVPGDSAAIEAAMSQMISDLPGVAVRPVRAVAESQGKVLDTIRGLLISLTALILVIVGVCLTATMSAIVMERKTDIAMMKALGATDRLVMRLFLVEGASLGLAGGLAGFVVGLLSAEFLGRQLFKMNVHPTWWTLPAVALATVTLALGATILPVQMTRTVEPARVLRGD